MQQDDIKYYLVQKSDQGPVHTCWAAEQKSFQEYLNEKEWPFDEIGAITAYKIWSAYHNLRHTEQSIIAFDELMAGKADDFSDLLEEINRYYWEEFSKSEYNDETELLIEAAGRDTLDRDAFLVEQQQERYKTVA